MLTKEDYFNLIHSQNVIKHVTDDDTANRRLSFTEILLLLEFILVNVKEIMFNKDGKPKSKIQLIGSIGKVIVFLIELTRRVTKDVKTKKPLNQRPLKDDSQWMNTDANIAV